MTGYSEALYARSLEEFGTPLELPGAGGWLLERPIPRSNLRDAMGCYPLFTCRDPGRLASDFELLRERLVTVVLVADPFLPWDDAARQKTFSFVRPWKEHYVIDLARFRPTRHHRYSARRALREIRVERCCSPPELLGDWVRLYSELVKRRGITGIQAFSESSFRRQLEVPGIVAFRATRGGSTVGGQLWYEQDGVGYCHLSASSAEGYEALSSYALYQAAIEEFTGRLRELDLGGPAGTEGPDSGLAFFKRGWSTGTRTAWLCGTILDPERYRGLAGEIAESGYFPAYRRGELTGARAG